MVWGFQRQCCSFLSTSGVREKLGDHFSRLSVSPPPLSLAISLSGYMKTIREIR